MAKDPLRTKFCDMMGIDFPIIAFTHCKDVVAAVVNAGAFAVLGEAMHTPDEIAADIKWIRERVGDKPFCVDLLLPASAPPADTLEELWTKIPETQRKFVEGIKAKHKVPEPKSPVGGDADANAIALSGVLAGKPSAYRDVALLNAAAALIVAGRSKDLKEGVAIGTQSLDSGAAAARLKHLVAVSNG